jgi:catechol 2,3-dioxygenase-like lactoylglutathione lyase family enzyme
MTKVVPQVPALNVAASLEFYTQKLGFGDAWQFNDGYGGVRTPFALNLCHYDDPHFAENYVMRFEVGDIQAHYARCQTHGIVHPKGLLERKPWGVWEFAVLDPSGVLIVFFEPTT